MKRAMPLRFSKKLSTIYLQFSCSMPGNRRPALAATSESKDISYVTMMAFEQMVPPGVSGIWDLLMREGRARHRRWGPEATAPNGNLPILCPAIKKQKQFRVRFQFIVLKRSSGDTGIEHTPSYENYGETSGLGALKKGLA